MADRIFVQNDEIPEQLNIAIWQLLHDLVVEVMGPLRTIVSFNEDRSQDVDNKIVYSLIGFFDRDRDLTEVRNTVGEIKIQNLVILSTPLC